MAWLALDTRTGQVLEKMDVWVKINALLRLEDFVVTVTTGFK